MKIFKYEPKYDYDFTLQATENASTQKLKEVDDRQNVYKTLKENLNYMQTRYNALINSDIIIRDFSIIVKNKEYKAFILYIDGMSDSILINQFILKPLMLRNKNNTYDSSNISKKDEESRSTITAKKIKKSVSQDTLSSYIYDRLVPQNNISMEREFSKIISDINSGNCALFVDSINVAFDIDVKGFKQRSVDKPGIENVIKGPQEAFVENIRTNTALLRRIVNNENFIIENIEIGNISKTKCALCYMQNISNDNLVGEARFRLNNLSLDSVLSSGELEQLIQDDTVSGIPQIISTERPDKCVKALLQGRAIILVNGNPYALIIPSVMTDFLASPEDSNLNPLFANFLKVIRLIAFIITLLLPRVIYCCN